MFDKDYSFYGQHGDKAVQLNTPIGNTKKSLFDRLLDVYLIAPIVGFLYQAHAEFDRGDGKSHNILLGQIMPERNRLEMNYRTIMLLDKQYEPDLDKRIGKAFRIANENREQTDIDWYESYVRGGIDKLYEKLIFPAKTPDDHFRLLDEFLEEFHDRCFASTSEFN